MATQGIELTLANRGMRRVHLLIAAAVLFFDRAAKWIVEQNVTLNDSIPVIPGFRLTHVQNRGAAFGLFADHPSQWKLTILVLFSLLAMTVVVYLLWKNSHTLSTTGIGLSLILGGAFGNLWDRLASGHVVDFLDFYLGPYHWPAFNIADSGIVIGALLLVAEIILAKPTAEDMEPL
jgi:signal peptidase II